MKQAYSFISHWQTSAPIAIVWDAIYQSEAWPQWWKGVISVKEIVPGDAQGIGSVRTYRLSSPMLYTLSFQLLLTERIDHKLLSGKASGELEGTGAWYFKEENGITDVQCHWKVETTVPWMNTFAAILKPLFAYNHRIVMQWGAQSLAKKIGMPVQIIC